MCLHLLGPLTPLSLLWLWQTGCQLSVRHLRRMRCAHSSSSSEIIIAPVQISILGCPTTKLTGKIKRSEERTQLYFVRVQRLVIHQLSILENASNISWISENGLIADS